MKAPRRKSLASKGTVIPMARRIIIPMYEAAGSVVRRVVRGATRRPS